MGPLMIREAPKANQPLYIKILEGPFDLLSKPSIIFATTKSGSRTKANRIESVLAMCDSTKINGVEISITEAKYPTFLP